MIHYLLIALILIVVIVAYFVRVGDIDMHANIRAHEHADAHADAHAHAHADIHALTDVHIDKPKKSVKFASHADIAKYRQDVPVAKSIGKTRTVPVNEFDGSRTPGW